MIDKKEDIAEASRRLMMSENLKRLTVKDIVEECQITRQTFYYYFEDIPAMFRWSLKRERSKVMEEVWSFHDMEKGMRYFFLVTISALPYVKKGEQLSYRDEIEKMLYEYYYSFFEQLVVKEHLYPNESYTDVKQYIRYHSYAVMGLIRNWTEEDDEHLEEIIHKICLMMKETPSS